MNDPTPARGRGWAWLPLLLLAPALWAGCASMAERPSIPVSLTVPSRINVATVDKDGVYDTLARYFADAGVPVDPEQSRRERGAWAGQPVRCAPGGDRRNAARCVFSAQVEPGGGAVASTIVLLKVRVLERVTFDPQQARVQVAIEPTLDRVVTELRSRFPAADVIQSDALQF